MWNLNTGHLKAQMPLKKLKNVLIICEIFLSKIVFNY